MVHGDDIVLFEVELLEKEFDANARRLLIDLEQDGLGEPAAA